MNATPEAVMATMLADSLGRGRVPVWTQRLLVDFDRAGRDTWAHFWRGFWGFPADAPAPEGWF